MPNVFDQFDSAAAAGAGGNVFDQFDEEKRRSPKAMKIGREGFEEAFRKTFRGSDKVSRNLAAFAAIPRSMYEGAKQYLGREDPAAITATRVMEQEDPKRALAGGLATAALASRIPGGATARGQTALGALTGALQPAQSSEERLFNTILGGGLGGLATLTLGQLGKLGAKWLQSGKTAASSTAAQQSVRDATIKESTSAGYVLPPSVTGGGKGSKVLESVAGKASVGQEASIRNQQVTNKIARAEAGLKPDEPINEATLAAAREQIAEPYRQIAALSPKASQDLGKLKQARADAKAEWQFYNRSADPKSLKKAQSLDAKAEALEQSIEREAVKATMGQGAQARALVDRLRDARVRLAKNYDVETAVNLGNGNVDAAVIGRMLNKRGEKGMTGGLATIGKFQQAFPTFARERPVGQSAPGVNYLKYPLALGLGYEGYREGERMGIGPYGAAAGALALASGPARSIALSRMVQGAPEYAPGMASRAANYLTNDPALRRLIPLSAVGLTLDAQK